MAEQPLVTDPPAASEEKETGPPTVNSEQIRKGDAFIDQAQKKLQSASSWLSKLTGSATKLEEAADLFTRAANQYKVGKDFEKAGDAFTEAAKIHAEKLDSRHEAANSYAEAAQVYKKKPAVEKAVESYQFAIDIYSDMGRFGLAARYYTNMAEIHEDSVQYEQSIRAYEQAADYYRGEDSNASANKCLTKVAHMCAQLEDYKKAAQLFEEIGKTCLDNGLLKYSAKDYFFKALICWMCLDREIVQGKMEEFKAIHPAFDGTREQTLIKNLLDAVLDEDTDKFAEHLQEYDSISRLDNWLTAQFLHIKKSIEAEPELN